MMKSMRISILFLVVLSMLWSCTPPAPVLYMEVNRSEAQSLKDYCAKKGIASAEVRKADSLFSDSKTKGDEGKNNEAYWMVDAAAVYYRLGITQIELTDAKASIDKLTKELATVQAQLKTYKEILAELDNMRNP